jgi:hypothetical protein
MASLGRLSLGEDPQMTLRTSAPEKQRRLANRSLLAKGQMGENRGPLALLEPLNLRTLAAPRAIDLKVRFPQHRSRGLALPLVHVAHRAHQRRFPAARRLRGATVTSNRSRLHQVNPRGGYFGSNLYASSSPSVSHSRRPFDLHALTASWTLNVPFDRHQYMVPCWQARLAVFAVLVANIMDECAVAAFITLDSDRFHNDSYQSNQHAEPRRRPNL